MSTGQSTPTVRDICTLVRFAGLFSVSRHFFASRVFMKGILCCVMRSNSKVELNGYARAFANFWTFLEVIGLSAVIYILLSLCRL